MQGLNAIAGAERRAEDRPSVVADSGTQKMSSSWDGQWPNWDDLGPSDPTPGGWGDVGS